MISTSDVSPEARYHGSSFSATYLVDAPLERNSELTLGYGRDGANPLRFFIPDGQDLDVGFFKFIFTTRPVDLEHMEEIGLFEPATEAGVRALDPQCFRRIDEDSYSYILVPVVLRREVKL